MGRRTALAITLAATAAVVAACTITRSVAPSATDPAITQRSGEHLVVVPALPQLRDGLLFVLFPGTGASPDDYTTLVTHAAEAGFHAISLDYENTRAVNYQICGGQPPDCFEQARLEILTGLESPWVEPDVDVANSAHHRLLRLVEHEAAAHPDEGWEQYLDDGALRWDRLVVAGHSQGGGHAAMTAKLHEVARVLLFGASEAQPWTLDDFATPADRFWGLAHGDERALPWITTSWANIGLPGELVELETTPPDDGSHRLVTTADTCTGDLSENATLHSCYVADRNLPPPSEDGTPAFAEVWDHMLTAA